MTTMMSDLNLGLVGHVRDALNIKRSDNFISYGLGPKTKEMMMGIAEMADSVCAVAVDAVEYEDGKEQFFPVYRSTKEFLEEQLNMSERPRQSNKQWERVFCLYDELPGSSRHLSEVLMQVYCLTNRKSMVLISGIPLASLPKTESFLSARHVSQYWFLNKAGGKFDLLYNTDHHCV